MTQSKWTTVRCVVEYRTDNPNFDERELTRVIQGYVNMAWADGKLSRSRPWAKQFKSVIARMVGLQPKKIQTAIKASEALTTKLRRL